MEEDWWGCRVGQEGRELPSATHTGAAGPAAWSSSEDQPGGPACTAPGLHAGQWSQDEGLGPRFSTEG